MKIALLMRNKKQPKNEELLGEAVLFDVEKDKVVGVENETLKPKNVEELSFWALTKRVKEIYIPEVDEQVRTFFRKMGINIKRYDELSDDRLFQTFIL